jgi:hypothetical protein
MIKILHNVILATDDSRSRFDSRSGVRHSSIVHACQWLLKTF